MDQHKLRSLVFEKTGVRVDIDDPIFALVALNEAVLAEAVERHVALIDAASQELVRHARHAGGIGGVGGVGSIGGSGIGSVAAPHADGAFIDATNEPVQAEAAERAGGATHVPAPALPVHAIATQAALCTPREMRLLGAAAGVSLLCALLVLGGQALFFKPRPLAAPVVQIQAKTLTPEQTLALQNGEKLARAVQKLDPKIRTQIQTELQKP